MKYALILDSHIDYPYGELSAIFWKNLRLLYPEVGEKDISIFSWLPKDVKDNSANRKKYLPNLIYLLNKNDIDRVLIRDKNLLKYFYYGISTKPKPKHINASLFPHDVKMGISQTMLRSILPDDYPYRGDIEEYFSLPSSDRERLFSNEYCFKGYIMYIPQGSDFVSKSFYMIDKGKRKRKKYKSPRRMKAYINYWKRFFDLPNPEPPKFKLINSLSEIEDKLKLAKYLFADIETIGDNPLDFTESQIHSFGIKTDFSDEIWIINYPTKDDWKVLYESLKDTEKTIVFHNGMFDLSHIMYHSGLDFSLVKSQDTQLLAFLSGLERELALKSLVQEFTMNQSSYVFGSFYNPAYLAADVQDTQALFDLFFPLVSEDAYLKTFLPKFSNMLADVKQHGMFYDRDALKQIEKEVRIELSDLEEKLKEYADINWDSPQQLSELLVRRKFPLKNKTSTGAFSVDLPSLTELLESSHPEKFIIQILLDYRGLKKYKSTYIRPYLANSGNIIRPNYLLTGTDTGRLASNNPNLQNIPNKGKIKNVFQSRFEGGFIGLFDLKSAETFTASLLFNDEKLGSKLVQDDFHIFNASKMLGKPLESITPKEKGWAKVVLFGLLYGGSAYALYHNINGAIPVATIENMIEEFYNLYPKVRENIERLIQETYKTERITTILGFNSDVSELVKSDYQKVAKKAVNTPIQSTSSYVNCIIGYYAWLYLKQKRAKSLLVNLIHDSVTFDVHPDEKNLVIEAVQYGCDMVKSDSPLGGLPLYDIVRYRGELMVGKSWANTEDKNELYNPLEEIKINYETE